MGLGLFPSYAFDYEKFDTNYNKANSILEMVGNTPLKIVHSTNE
jgi:hypothetical protein